MPPYAAQLRLDRARARRGLYPSVQPSLCWSRALTEDVVGASHVRLAAAARTLLEQHVADDPQLLAVAKAEITDPQFASQPRPAVEAGAEHQRSLSLLHYLAQPFHVAEPFTGRPGQWVTHDELLRDLQALLDA
jgi:F-type H+-transporting ATPase subunit beta